MPIYEYSCKRCNRIFEVLQSINDKPLEKCPQFCQDKSGESFYKCDGKLTKLISNISGFILKGKGFFRNDYPKE